MATVNALNNIKRIKMTRIGSLLKSLESLLKVVISASFSNVTGKEVVPNCHNIRKKVK